MMSIRLSTISIVIIVFLLGAAHSDDPSLDCSTQDPADEVEAALIELLAARNLSGFKRDDESKFFIADSGSFGEPVLYGLRGEGGSVETFRASEVREAIRKSCLRLCRVSAATTTTTSTSSSNTSITAHDEGRTTTTMTSSTSSGSSASASPTTTTTTTATASSASSSSPAAISSSATSASAAVLTTTTTPSPALPFESSRKEDEESRVIDGLVLEGMRSVSNALNRATSNLTVATIIVLLLVLGLLAALIYISMLRRKISSLEKKLKNGGGPTVEATRSGLTTEVLSVVREAMTGLTAELVKRRGRSDTSSLQWGRSRTPSPNPSVLAANAAESRLGGGLTLQVPDGNGSVGIDMRNGRASFQRSS